MGDRDDAIEAMASLRRRTEVETVTLLCGCRDESHCHRTLLKALIQVAVLSVASA